MKKYNKNINLAELFRQSLFYNLPQRDSDGRFVDLEKFPYLCFANSTTVRAAFQSCWRGQAAGLSRIVVD
jgi:hypothetical protein